MFEKLKLWYEHGVYTAEMVHLFVSKGIVTEEQYLAICKADNKEE